MVRISIPTLPPTPKGLPPSALTLLPKLKAAAYLGEFLANGKGKTLMITGAGVSVDSGIRAYRGSEGSYSNPNYKWVTRFVVPVGGRLTKRVDQYSTLSWWKVHREGRCLGNDYPPVRDAKPNPNHVYIAALQSLGLAPNLITQNVDNLHPKALNMVIPSKARILELHGTLAKVHCLGHLHEQPRDDYQAQIARDNPIWEEGAKEAARTGTQPRTNPDGDVDLQGANYESFAVPKCRICQDEERAKSIVKPNVVFFGETLDPKVKEESFSLVTQASSLLVMGTSLATYSCFRLVKQALEQKKPVLMISLGPSRADGLPGVEKMEREAGPVLRAYLDEVIKSNTGPEVDRVKEVLDLGVVQVPPEIEGPRAEG
ncbi:hypothetical protein P7C73_g5481, partial [Tremellales sp. Uapishka_1]